MPSHESSSFLFADLSSIVSFLSLLALARHAQGSEEFLGVTVTYKIRHLHATVEPGISELFCKVKKFHIRLVTIYVEIYARNEFLGVINISVIGFIIKSLKYWYGRLWQVVPG